MLFPSKATVMVGDLYRPSPRRHLSVAAGLFWLQVILGVLVVILSPLRLPPLRILFENDDAPLMFKHRRSHMSDF